VRICIATSGGDAPGLNAVLRGATATALGLGHTMVGSRNGFDGILGVTPGGRGTGLLALTEDVVDGIDGLGGTILGAASRGQPFGPSGDIAQFVRELDALKIDALVMAGGDGTMQIAGRLAEAGVRVVGVPKTIDRDVSGTFTTFGFDTAVQTAVDAITRIHSTAESHDRLMVVECMGRDAGWIALYAGITGGAHAIAIPEIPYDLRAFERALRRRQETGYRYHILVCAEGARALGGTVRRSERTGRYGGVGEYLATELESRISQEARHLSLGHLLRGGPPTATDRLLGLQFGAAAVDAVARGESGVMVSYQPPSFVSLPFSAVVGRSHRIQPASSPDVHTARRLGISFGD
jgi:6-phosphofructokinase